MKLARPLLFLALLALTGPPVEASLSRATSPAIEPPALTLAAPAPALALDPYAFPLFAGDELARAADDRQQHFHPLAAVSLLSEDGADGLLVSAGDKSYPKTRVWAIDVLGSTLVSRLTGLSLESHWACGDFSCGLASGGRKDPLGLANDIDIRSNPDVRAEYCKRVPQDCTIWEREPIPVVEVMASTATGNPRKDLGQLYAHGMSDVGAMATLGRRYRGNARQNAVVMSIGKTIEPAAPYIEALFYFSLLFSGPIPETGAFINFGSRAEMAEAARALRVVRVQGNRVAGNAARDAIAAREAPALIEQRLTALGGDRVVDVLKIEDDLTVLQLNAQRVGIESKVGETALTSRVRQELARDWWLRRQGQLDQVIWEFSPSEVTGKVGPSKPLQEMLDKLGFETKINRALP